MYNTCGVIVNVVLGVVQGLVALEVMGNVVGASIVCGVT